MWRLFIGAQFTGLTVRPDERWPKMWRIHYQGRTSDMVNLSRAKDAAISWVRSKGLGGGTVANWDYRQTPSEQAQARSQSREAVPGT